MELPFPTTRRLHHSQIEEQFKAHFDPFVTEILDGDLLERFAQIPSEVKNQCPRFVTTVLSNWMHRIVEDFSIWIRDVLLLSKFVRIYLSETATLETTNTDSIELIINSYQLVKFLLNQPTATKPHKKHVVFELIFGTCQLCIVATTKSSWELDSNEADSIVDAFFDLIQLSLFTTHWLSMITAEEHFSLSQKFIFTINVLTQTNQNGARNIGRRLFELGKASFEFLATKSDHQKEFRGYGLLNVCFKDLVKFIKPTQNNEINPVLQDCFHFLTAALLATSSSAFIENNTAKLKISKFWVCQLCKMADTFSEELVDFIGDVLQLAWKISAHLAPTNTDTPEKVSIKREGIGAILEKIAKCLVILSTKLTSSETESWLLKVTEGQTGDQELDPGSFVLTLASIMKNSNKMSNEFALAAISRLLSSTLEILAKIQIQQKELKIHVMNGALRLFSEAVSRQTIHSDAIHAFNSLIWSSSPFICCFLAEFWCLITKRSSEDFVKNLVLEILDEIRFLCSLNNALLMEHSTPEVLEISVLSMIHNASFIFLSIYKDLNENLKSLIFDELTSTIDGLFSISCLAVLMELKALIKCKKLETGVVQSVVKISYFIMESKGQGVTNFHGLHLYWNLRLLKSLHSQFAYAERSIVNANLSVAICQRLFEFTNLHIKSKIWILVLRESLELMNLNFESTKNWPRIEQSLLTLLRSSELFPLVHYPVFENCKLMAKYKLSPQKDLMHCLWSNASKCWFIERLCFQATIAVSRTAHGHPLDLVPTTIYSPNQSTDDQSFMNKLAAMMKQDIPKNTNNFHIPFTVFYLLNEEMVNTLRNSMSAIKLEGQKLTKKRQRSSPQRVRQEKKSAEAAINSLEETVRVISTLCQDLDPAVVTARKRTVLKDQIGQCLSSLNSLYRKL